jgi:hypothetical protein
MYLPVNALTTRKQFLCEMYLLSSIRRNTLPLVKSILQLINLNKKIIRWSDTQIYYVTPNATISIVQTKSFCKRSHGCHVSEQECNCTSCMHVLYYVTPNATIRRVQTKNKNQKLFVKEVVCVCVCARARV